MELRDRVAVVTGGSSGIGFAVAEALGRAGCRVAICARDPGRLEQARDRLRRTAPEVLAVTADVSRREDVERFAARVREELGPADVLVNNAGTTRFGRFLDLTAEDFDDVFAVNVRGVFLCSRAFVPEMVERGDGVVVNVSSLAGRNAFPKGAVYAASKHAVMGLSRSMMLDLRGEGVRVLTVCPGSVDTRFFDGQEHLKPDRGRILQAAAVADLVVEAVRLSDRGTVSEVEIRPVNP